MPTCMSAVPRSGGAPARSARSQRRSVGAAWRRASRPWVRRMSARADASSPARRRCARARRVRRRVSVYARVRRLEVASRSSSARPARRAGRRPGPGGRPAGAAASASPAWATQPARSPRQRGQRGAIHLDRSGHRRTRPRPRRSSPAAAARSPAGRRAQACSRSPAAPRRCRTAPLMPAPRRSRCRAPAGRAPPRPVAPRPSERVRLLPVALQRGQGELHEVGGPTDVAGSQRVADRLRRVALLRRTTCWPAGADRRPPSGRSSSRWARSTSANRWW